MCLSKLPSSSSCSQHNQMCVLQVFKQSVRQQQCQCGGICTVEATAGVHSTEHHQNPGHHRQACLSLPSSASLICLPVRVCEFARFIHKQCVVFKQLYKNRSAADKSLVELFKLLQISRRCNSFACSIVLAFICVTAAIVVCCAGNVQILHAVTWREPLALR